jgi:DNA-binding response OmpR family regulator
MAARILFVEDNANTALAMKVVLELRGHKVDTASTVKTALDKIAANTYDVVISDISLPDGTGHDVLEKSSKPVKAIGLSGFTSESDREKALQSGFSEYLTKPFRNEDLFEAIKRVSG